MVREIFENELNELLELYLHLHEDSVPAMSEHLRKTWKTIVQDKNHLAYYIYFYCKLPCVLYTFSFS